MSDQVLPDYAKVQSSRFLNSMTVRNADECFPLGEKAPECVAEYWVYFPHSPNMTLDPYSDGIVVERWKDGRFYFLDGNTETFGTLAEIETLVEQFARDYGKLPSPAAAPTDPIRAGVNRAAEYMRDNPPPPPRPAPEFGGLSPEMIRAHRITHIDGAPVAALDHRANCPSCGTPAPAKRETIADRAERREHETEGGVFLPEHVVFCSDCGSVHCAMEPCPYRASVFTVQELFDELFPRYASGTRGSIHGGGDMPIDSTCGRGCADALIAAFNFARHVAADCGSDKVVDLVVEQCEIYING